ncbi:hypothetical protein MJO29_005352 [Puccinia striiformis f. sp. tritici]|nr:hypothetical protein MJO29_005352 [Puccinia striiformis f. sp. tritici]
MTSTSIDSESHSHTSDRWEEWSKNQDHSTSETRSVDIGHLFNQQRFIEKRVVNNVDMTKGSIRLGRRFVDRAFIENTDMTVQSIDLRQRFVDRIIIKTV